MISNYILTIMKVTYPGGAEVNQGNELTPTQVKDCPAIKFAADASKLYTLCFVDPDAPSRVNPKFGEWLHWLVVNMPGDNVDGGDSISDYVGSGPPKGSGLHRYIFLAFEQTGKMACEEPRHTKTSGKHRSNFKTRDFVQKYGLGQPVAGNFYQAAYDDYVPQLYAQLKD